MRRLKNPNAIYKLYFIISFIILLNCISIINPVKAETKSISKNENIYAQKSLNLRSLTAEQVAHFLKTKNITALFIKTIGIFTVILSESNNIVSSFNLTSDENGSIKCEDVSTSTCNANSPVFIGSAGGSLGLESYFFNWIVINDKEILNNTHSIRITYNDKTETSELVNNSKGFIFPTTKYKFDELTISICSRTGNVLYKYKK